MKRLDGWKFDEVTEFLKLHGFIFDHTIPGSHEFWIKENTKEKTVNVNFTKGTFVIRTLETMIRQSGIEKEHWIRYTQLPSNLRKKCKCCDK